MGLVEAYQKVKASIVAFVPKFHIIEPNASLPQFPPIFGTGFIVGEGLIVTNDHVIKKISRLPRPPDCPPNIWPVNCLFLCYDPLPGVATIHLEVLDVLSIVGFETGEIYYGPPKPDIAFVHVKMKGLPHVNVRYNHSDIVEGREIATAGFPMGTHTLMAPGYLHQITPTLQRGIISAVLPFQCESPHALMINVMVQGGASGSPVFLADNGDVIGVLYAGLEDIKSTLSVSSNGAKNLDPSLHAHLFKAPTNISYVVPAHYIEKMLEVIINEERCKFPEDTPSLEKYIETAKVVVMKPGDPQLIEKWEGPDSLKRTIKTIKPD
jgi:hypothetical protein